MKLEDLANEILLDLFELLDDIHLLHAFNGLNSRFNMLLFNRFQTYHLDFRSLSKHNFSIVCQQYLPIIINQVITLHLSNDNETPNLLQLFLSYDFTLNRFNHLQTLSLYHMDSLSILNEILLQCHHLPYLIHLNVIKCNFDQREREILYLINNIWSLSKLTHCNLDNIFVSKLLFTSMPTISQSIEYLSMKNIYCPLSILFNLFQCTPCLRCIHIMDVIGYEDEQLQPIVSSLSSMNISFSGSMYSLEKLFRIVSNLYSLTIRTSSMFLNGYEWEEIIINHLSKIKVFRLKMEFSFPTHKNKEEQIDKLLDSFRTHFWIDEHQWFIQYDYIPTNAFNCDVLYTLPYAFEDLTYASKQLSKSTCPENKIFQRFDRVKVLRYSNQDEYLSNESNTHSSRFLNIRHLEIDLPFNDHLFTIVSLNRLVSLHITLPLNSDHFLLEGLLDRIPHLYSLTIQHWSSIHPTLFQVKNESLRRLVFVQSPTIPNNFYFNNVECTALSNSPLGFHCEVLVIDVQCQTNILELIKTMTNLRSLTVQCNDDEWNIWSSSTANDELVTWLQKHLSSTCLVIRDPKKVSNIQIWIDS
ncbi:unnamed protein product [Rotaria sp. Silwood2]|nr:unnamed protein product [Rotaria sp. Silwood2]CAF3043620.1 unnamed protein product [Rotaria sp. Silwood2]CAF3456319.1 unnamed protein product [Rotaria sp. Silwood2]CAF3896916.1 unnamed protein product [Rotaria sp. Silwood2]CAF4240051.1 unnamed protein product [Rotaria sp. Silwood2]